MLKKIGRYLLNGLIWLDQGVNWLLGGSPDHTVSGRIGYNSRKGNKFAAKIEWVINTLLFWDKDHCYESIEWVIMKRDYPLDDVSKIRKSK